MQHPTPFRFLNPPLAVVVCALILCRTGFSQPPGSAWARARAQLSALQACIGPSLALSDLDQGLMSGWNRKDENHQPQTAPLKPTPPPPAYLDSLDRDIRACRLASQLSDQQQRRIILKTVVADIEIKAEDCHKFGMGRLVPLTVTTLRGATAENGWQVFYRWICSSPFQSDELRVPNLTSPASVQLPPGVYSIRAEKRFPDARVETIAPVRVVIGSAPAVPLQLTIP